MQEPKDQQDSQNDFQHNQDNRRKFPRIKRHYFLWFAEKSNPQIQFQVSQVENISQGGVCFSSSSPLKEGDLLVFKLQTPYIDDVVYCDGVVVAVREKAKGLIYSIHVQFEKVTPVLQAVLEKIEKYNIK